jgi:hypothetical protein
MLQGGAGRCKRLAVSHGRFDSYIKDKYKDYKDYKKYKDL